MPKVPFNDLKLQLDTLQPQMGNAIQSIIERTAFVGGSEIAAFETEFAAYCEVAGAVGVGNGTDAIEIALWILGVGSGDEVIVPSHTFIASAEPIVRLGATPVFVECDAAFYTIDVEACRRAVTKRTKAIIAVHLYGQPCDMDPINEIAKEYGLKVVEDAAQAHGARYKGRRVGTLGDIATFSFYPGKNLGAYGDAGAIVSNDLALLDRARRIANHGRAKNEKFNHSRIGCNSRLDGIQAAVLRVKLQHLDKWNERRRAVAARYSAGLKDVVQVPVDPNYAESVYHLYVIQSQDRDKLRDALGEEDIQTGLHYPVAVHQHGGFRDYFQDEEISLPVTEQAVSRILSLPIFPKITDEQIDCVIAAVHKHEASA
jgi:dTDP-4-amino-4,6-dideoxygalactose transaminase